MIFHNKGAKIGHFYCFPQMLAGSSGIVKVVFIIIKVCLLLQNRALKYSTKNSKTLFVLVNFVSCTVHELLFINAITNYKGHYE